MKHIQFLVLIFLTVNVMAQTSEKVKKETTSLNEVEVRHIEPFQYVYYEFKGSYMEAFKDFPKLMEYLGKNGIQPGKYSLGVYYDDPLDVPEKDLRSEIGMMVTKPEKVSDGYKYKNVDGFKAATIRYTEMEQIMDAYDKVFKYVESNGMTPAGAPYEFYYSYEPGNLDCEIIVPVE